LPQWRRLFFRPAQKLYSRFLQLASRFKEFSVAPAVSIGPRPSTRLLDPAPRIVFLRCRANAEHRRKGLGADYVARATPVCNPDTVVNWSRNNKGQIGWNMESLLGAVAG
jgi:uncharacterized membrane protein YeaQ/YmgE (transglycosylase-associated protein family)